MNNTERFMECVDCIYLMHCTLDDGECEDENGHCMECFTWEQLKEKKE